jgi:hypothetical protein
VRSLGRTASALVTLVVTTTLLAVPVAPAAGTAKPGWAPTGSAKITPGVQMFTKGAQCSGNFVFRDRSGRVYVGYAAHCAGLGQATDTNGCSTESHPLGTRVTFRIGAGTVTGGEVVGRGRLAYSSWVTMRRLGMRTGAACAYNDFALVKVRKRDRGKVNPSLPVWGGPVGMAKGAAIGGQVYSVGSSSLRGGVELLGPKTGVVTYSHGSGWSHSVYTVTPGIPGDSGSGVVDEQGRALGTLSTIAIAPFPGENGIGDLRKQLRFARQHGGLKGLRLVKGTEPFSRIPG